VSRKEAELLERLAAEAVRATDEDILVLPAPANAVDWTVDSRDLASRLGRVLEAG
jgi:hypothetical protein